jgi:hypothetical protein
MTVPPALLSGGYTAKETPEEGEGFLCLLLETANIRALRIVDPPMLRGGPLTPQ